MLSVVCGVFLKCRALDCLGVSISRCSCHFSGTVESVQSYRCQVWSGSFSNFWNLLEMQILWPHLLGQTL